VSYCNNCNKNNEILIVVLQVSGIMCNLHAFKSPRCHCATKLPIKVMEYSSTGLHSSFPSNSSSKFPCIVSRSIFKTIQCLECTHSWTFFSPEYTTNRHTPTPASVSMNFQPLRGSFSSNSNSLHRTTAHATNRNFTICTLPTWKNYGRQ
jgi:hypothetical protein